MTRSLSIALVIAALSFVGGNSTAAAPGPQQKNTSRVDLVQVQLIVPGKLKVGKVFQVLDEVENQGTMVAFESTTLFYLSKDDTLDEFDVIVGGRRVPQLGNSQSHSAHTPVTLKPGIEPGDYYFLAVADGKNELEERYKDNNVRAVKVKVLPTESGK